MKAKASLITVTPKKAEEFLSHNTYAGQRNASSRHIQEIGDKLSDGRFHIGNVALVYNGSTILADGQHQCHACVATGKSFKAVLQEYTVEEGDTKEDIARVFSQFNVDKSRTRGDIAWIHGCQLGMSEWPRRCVTICNTAIGWLESGLSSKNYVSLTKDQNAALLGKYKKQCQFVYDVLFSEGGRHRHMMRSPVVAAMIVTCTRSRQDAEKFWCSVRDGDLLTRGAPAFVLREWLMRAVVTMGSAARGEREKSDSREMYSRCIVAWNAFRNGEDRAHLKYSQKSPTPKAK